MTVNDTPRVKAEDTVQSPTVPPLPLQGAGVSAAGAGAKGPRRLQSAEVISDDDSGSADGVEIDDLSDEPSMVTGSASGADNGAGDEIVDLEREVEVQEDEVHTATGPSPADTGGSGTQQ